MDKTRRNYSLSIDAVGTPYSSTSSLFPDTSGVEKIGIDLPFTIEFDVTRAIGGGFSNNATISIYNLAESTRKKIFKDAYTSDIYKGIELKAGYNDTIPTIFKGNIIQAGSVRRGVNYITTIQCADGGFGVTNGQINKEFPKGTTQAQIFGILIRSMPNIQTGAISKLGADHLRGSAYSGNSAEILGELSDGAFFVDLEKGYVLGDSDALEGTLALIDASTGLLGTPVKEEKGLTLQMIFEPRLLVGQVIELKSQESIFNGFYKVMGVHHHGMISDTVAGAALTDVTLFFGQEQLKIVKQNAGA